MGISKEQKEAIEYLKTRLYGNKGCKYIDVAQEDLRIFINLVDRKEKDIEGWKKYCEEIEEEQTEMSNKNCKLEFEVEKLKKENEELEEINNELEAEKNEAIRRYNFETIPIKKVKDKIEYLEDYIEENSDEQGYWGNINSDIIYGKIEILEELLESEE